MSISENIKRLKRTYRNSRKGEKIGRDLIAPCLRECVRYRRGTGTFTSSILSTYIRSIDEILDNNTKIEILCSPQIDETLFNSLTKVTSEENKEKLINDFIDEFICDSSGINKDISNREYKEKLLSYLISKDILEIRFAIPVNDVELEALIYRQEEEPSFDNLSTRNMYHIKQGYFVFEGGARLGFDGSINETDTALTFNQEKARVFKSWIPNDAADLKELIHDVDRDYGALEGDRNENIRIYPIGERILERIKQENQHRDRPKRSESKKEVNEVDKSQDNNSKYRHQDEAVEIFLQKKNGILNMATGTGKTRTALKIINKLTENKLIDQFIITCYGVDLLEQWHVIMYDCKEGEAKEIAKHYPRLLKGKIDRQKFSFDPEQSGLLTSLDDVYHLETMDDRILERTLIIYDEVHNLGTESRVSKLSQLNKKITYRLGLSATPDKGKYNTEMTHAIQSEIGDIIYTFSLEDAIKRGILCEFNYELLEYRLDRDDKDKIKRVQAARSTAKKEGRPMADEEFARLIANVYKTSETKLESFHQLLRSKKHLLESTIIFVQTEDYGKKVMEIIKDFTYSYKTYYGKTERKYLDSFIDGDIDILVTCEAISQGIDIPNLQNIVIFSSDKNLGKTVQRLGRCLRNPPSEIKKIATVVDFGEIPDKKQESYDAERVEWLTGLSKIKNEDA